MTTPNILQYQVARNGQVVGQFSTEEIKWMISSGELLESDHVYTEGFDNWKTIAEVPDLMPSSPAALPLPVSSPTEQVGSVGIKPKLPKPFLIGLGAIAITVGVVFALGVVSDEVPSEDGSTPSGIGGGPVASLGGTPTPLSPQLRIFWEDAGFETGWMGSPNSPKSWNPLPSEEHRMGFIHYSWKLEDLEASMAVPTFRYLPKPDHWNHGALKSLQAPTTAFGLNFEAASVLRTMSDELFKDMVKFKQLSSLSLKNMPITDDILREVAKLTQLTMLDLTRGEYTVYPHPYITDEGLREVTKLTQLTILSLRNRNISAAGLKEVAKLRQLSSLDLCGVGDGSSVRITDEGLKEVVKLQQLTSLDLSYAQITNVGLTQELVKLKKLSNLRLIGTDITAAGVALLKQKLPKCKITLRRRW